MGPCNLKEHLLLVSRSSRTFKIRYHFFFQGCQQAPVSKLRKVKNAVLTYLHCHKFQQTTTLRYLHKAIKVSSAFLLIVLTGYRANCLTVPRMSELVIERDEKV